MHNITQHFSISCHQTWPSVLWRCWLGGKKGIRPVKNWMVGCWHGYLSGARCRLACGPADITATHCLSLQWNPDWFLPFWYWLTRVARKKGRYTACACKQRLFCGPTSRLLCGSTIQKTEDVSQMLTFQTSHGTIIMHTESGQCGSEGSNYLINAPGCCGRPAQRCGLHQVAQQSHWHGVMNNSLLNKTIISTKTH